MWRARQTYAPTIGMPRDSSLTAMDETSAVIMRKALKVIKINRTLVALLVVAGVVLLSASSALAFRGRVFGPSFGSPGSGAGQLSLSSFTSGTVTIGGSGVAADEVTHNVYVADTGNNRVDEFTSAGLFVRAWGWGVVNGASELQVCTEQTGCRSGLPGANPGQFTNVSSVVVDESPGGKGDVYVANHYEEGAPGSRVQKFTAEGVLIESWGSKGQIDAENIPEKELSAISGVAIAPGGELLVGSGIGVLEFSQSSGVFVERLEPDLGGYLTTNVPDGLAIDSFGNLYWDEPSKKEIEKFNIGDKELSGVFRSNINFYTGLAVAQSGELYLDEGNAIQVIAPSCNDSCVPATTFSSPILTDGAGLAVDSRSEVVYIAEVAADKIESIEPEPPAAPFVEADSQTVTDVSGDSATLEATVNPRSEPNEEPTSYRFQYTSDESFQREGFAGASGIPVPDGQLTPSYEADLVTTRLQGLAPGTTYHYRVYAENAISRKEGKPTEGERDSAGEEVVRTFTTQGLGVFALPDGRVWELVSPANKLGARIEATTGQTLIQASVDGDAFTYLASAPTEPSPEGNSNKTQVLSTRTATGASSWGSRDLTTPREAANGLIFGDNVFQEYRFFSADLSFSVVNPFGLFDPSISPEASEQTSFLRSDFLNGDPTDLCSSSCYRPLATGAPGFANVPEGTEFGEGRCNTGQAHECGPVFLGASPDASHIVLLSRSAALTEGAPREGLYEWASGQLQLVSVLPNTEPAQAGVALGNDAVGGSTGNARNAVSTDGSRVVWSTSGKGQSLLYLRDMAREETVQVGGVGAEFETASSDDARVFFTIAGDLYVFEAPAGAALSAGHVTNLTPAGGVLGVPGASQDGSYVYFVATSALTGAEANEHGETALNAHPNLYVANGGSIKLAAVLSREDQPDWAEGGVKGIGTLTSRVSPNGRWLEFMSERSLSGYDNRDVSSGMRDEEVFLFDTAANGGRGGLVCASCDPTGARPHGVFDTGQIELLVDREFDWPGRWLAGNVPAWTSPVYQSRYLSDSGRLFFNSADALASSDTNGMEDVYEYEPPGVGNCTSESPTFSLRPGGCVDLISSGVSKEESAFMDASESGDDVFFLTSAQLSKQDTDATPDVYDARVDGGSPEPQAPPACEGDACQSPVAAPTDPTPGSLTYHGPGNPVPLLTPSKVTTKKGLKCAKGKKLSHGKCVKSKVKSRKKARKTGHTTAKRRAGNKRGAKS